MRHKEETERLELQRAADLLEKIAARKKALEKYERAKRKQSMMMEEKNAER